MKKKISMELSPKSKEQGYTVKANLNPEYVKLVHVALRDTGRKVSEAIKQGNAKEAIKLVREGKMQKDALQSHIDLADKIVYDKDRNSIAWFHTDTRKCYELEREETAC